jgi:lambda family phage portal protein
MLAGLGRAIAGGLKAWSGGDGSGLEAGRMGRRLGGWVPSRSHVNTLINSSGSNTLARARFLARNNGYAFSAVECFSSNLVGAGITPSWKSPLSEGGDNAVAEAAAQKKSVHALWARWVDEADCEGVTDFYGLQKRIAREMFIAGEIFVRLRPRYLSDGLSIPLQLELLPSEQLPVWLNMPLANGNWIRQGIEFDRIGRRVAYHFWRVNPGDITLAPKFGERIRIPASQIIHVFDPLEAGQIRGLSRLTPAIVTLWMLDIYDDAELDRKKTAALFNVFIRRADPDGEIFDNEKAKTAQTPGAAADEGPAAVKLEPGAAHVLLPGEDISTAAPADSGQSFEPFQYRILTRVCAALGLPYAGVTGDVRQASYGSQRAAMIEARRRAEAIQHGVIAFQFCRPVFRAFLDSAHIAGALNFDGYADDPQDYLQMDWIPPRWMWIDPLKDRQAEILAVDAGFKARSQVIEEEGYDAAEVDQRIADDAARAERLGITLQGSQGLKKLLSEPPPDTVDDSGNPMGEDATPNEDREPTSSPVKKTAPPKPKPPKAHSVSPYRN